MQPTYPAKNRGPARHRKLGTSADRQTKEESVFANSAFANSAFANSAFANSAFANLALQTQHLIIW
jgi:hypothetical protein